MLIPRFLLKKLLAALLSVTLIWVFVACVSICTRESREGHLKSLAVSPNELADASDCKGCPVTAFPKARVPERLAQDADTQTPAAVRSLILSVDPSAGSVSPVTRERQRLYADPPRKRLTALRI